MFSVKNFDKPSNKKWKIIADIWLYSLPLLQGAILTMPVNEKVQNWIIFGISILIVGFKALSKFTTNENTEVQQ